MGIVRTYALVFIAGWVVWFLLDKSAPVVPLPAPAPYGTAQYPVFPTAPRQPPSGGDMVQTFQYSVDLLRRGRYQQGFVYLWRRESWILTAVITLLLSFLLPGIGRSIRRWRSRRATNSKGV